MKAVIIGSGNVAHYLSLHLAQQHHLLQIAGRNKKEVAALARKCKCSYTLSLDQLDSTADIIILAVSDNSISSVVKQLPATNKIVLHTSGSTSLTALKKFKNAGVLYPLQSLRKGFLFPDKETVFCLEASNIKTRSTLILLARSMGSNVVTMDSNKRLKLHLAAVVVNNFVNYLHTLSHDFLEDNHIDFSLLMPLIRRTASASETAAPSMAQTGPALRNDTLTLHKHLALLKKYPELKKLYTEFSNGIHQYYKMRN